MLDSDKIKRVIFDIDYTLLIPNYDEEGDVLIKKYLPNCGNYFLEHKYDILKEYESKYIKYERNTLIEYLNKYSKQQVDDKFLDAWFLFGDKLKKQDVSEVEDVLKYLKEKGKELVVLSNWFTEVQIRKLKKVGLFSYFDEIYGGDFYLKPYKESYLLAKGSHLPEECVMIGDSLLEDVEGAEKVGMNAIYYTRGNEMPNYTRLKIKNFKELKNIL